MLVVHPGRESANAAQGAWQAYGQMRAARTLGRYTLLTSGVLGAWLAAYQSTLSKQDEKLADKESQLKKKDKELEEKEIEMARKEAVIFSALDSVQVREQAAQEAISALEAQEKIVNVYDKYVQGTQGILKDFCSKQTGDKRCIEYQKASTAISSLKK
jgi:PDZ domain-containing secreted protein